MFRDERASWHAERAQWKRERKALLDYFETEREALVSQTESAKLELQHVLDFLARVRELRYEDGVPPAEEEVDDYLTYLKIDGSASRVQLRWLAEEAMHAPLPYGWTAHRHPDTLEPYYYHRPTQTSSYEHPVDDLCRVTAQNLTNALMKQRNAHGVVASVRAELEARDRAIDAVEKALDAKKLKERAAHEHEAMELLVLQVTKSVKAAKGKAAKEQAKEMVTQAEEQAAESKRRAEDAEMAYLNASFVADEAKEEADRRTRARQNRSPWKDDLSHKSASAPAAAAAAAAAGPKPNTPSLTAGAGGLPSGRAPPKNTLLVTIVSAQSIGLGSGDDMHTGGIGGSSLVFCVVRIANWYGAVDATAVRRLPEDQDTPNEINWVGGDENDPQPEEEPQQAGGGDGDGSRRRGCKVSFENLRGSREGPPTAVTIELRRRPVDVRTTHTRSLSLLMMCHC
jgi:hypothetical protein